MNKKIYTLSELMNELVVAEGILGTSSVDANVAEASTSQPRSKGKGKKKKKKKKKKDFTKKKGKQIALGVANKERRSKENVSIVVRKDIRRGIVQNSRLPIIRV